MRERNKTPRLTYGKSAFKAIFETLDLTTEAEKARFLDIAESSFNRVHRGVMRPGEDFIARTMNAVANEPRLAGHPFAEFQKLFPIEKAVAA